MSNETQNANQNSGGKSLLAQVREEASKAKREAAKAKLKTLYADYNKATEVLEGIENQIVELLKDVGENEDAVKAMLGSE
jgi:predicted transcriptional regulator